MKSYEQPEGGFSFDFCLRKNPFHDHPIINLNRDRQRATVQIKSAAYSPQIWLGVRFRVSTGRQTSGWSPGRRKEAREQSLSFISTPELHVSQLGLSSCYKLFWNTHERRPTLSSVIFPFSTFGAQPPPSKNPSVGRRPASGPGASGLHEERERRRAWVASEPA